MKLTANRTALLSAVNLAAAASNGKLKPILGCVLLRVMQRVNETLFSASGTDLEIVVESPLAACTDADIGRCVVAADKLLAILRVATSDEITIEEQPHGNVEVRSGLAVYELPTHPVDEYPVTGANLDVDLTGQCCLPAQALREALGRAIPVVGEQGKYATGGVRLEFDGETLTVVATDAKRLVICEQKAKLVDSLKVAAVATIPERAAKAIRQAIEDNTEHAQILFGKDSVSVLCYNGLDAASGGRVYTRQLEGRYPPWREIIPKGKLSSVQVDSETFARAVRQAAVMTDAETRRLSLDFTAEGLTMSSRSPQGQTRVKVDATLGGALTIHLDPRYLLDALAAVGETASLGFKSGDHPVLIASPGVACILMPQC